MCWYSYSTPLTPTMSNCYWQWPNHLETWSGLPKSVFCLGKAQKVISNSHHRGDYFIGCMNTMFLQSHYKNPEYPLALRKGRLDTRPSHPTPMQWSFSGIRDFNSPWPGGEESVQIVGIWPPSHSPTIQEEIDSPDVHSL